MVWQEHKPAHGQRLKKGDMGQIKKRKPTPKQYLSQRRNVMQRMKTQELIYAAKVKQIPERAIGSDKPKGNGKRVEPEKQWTYTEEGHAHKAQTAFTCTQPIQGRWAIGQR